MKISQNKTRAFTRTELLLVVAIAGLFGLLFVRAQENPAAKARPQRFHCISNIKMIGLGFRMWANDNDGLFPMRVAAAKGGSREAITTGETFRHFAALSNMIPNITNFTCLSDVRLPATSFATLQNTNVSYFVGLDADETKPQMLLSGDRNLTNGLPRKNGVLVLSLEAPEGWTAEMHVQGGNLGLADGSAQQVTPAGLRRQIEAQRLSTGPEPKRLQFPE